MPGQNYDFSCWLGSVYTGSPANILVRINGQVRQELQLTASIEWVQVAFSWAAESSEAVVELVDTNLDAGGNDFGLDDIHFVGPIPCSGDAGPAEPVILTQWTTVQYEKFDQPDAVWQLSDADRVATQLVNADASILLSDFNATNIEIGGTWSVQTGDDDDLIGFVFGYQDQGHYYLFDWKQGSQGDPCGFSEAGMSLKVVEKSATLTCQDMWPTTGSAGVRLLMHNTIPWADFREYEFKLRFVPDSIQIEVRELPGGAVLASWRTADPTYSSGKFGFYNYSQGAVRYAGFTKASVCPRAECNCVAPTIISLPPLTGEVGVAYQYDVQAIEPGNHTLRYFLLDRPLGMSLDPITGALRWTPNDAQSGSHFVRLEVRDEEGRSATQRFYVTVRRPGEDSAPPQVALLFVVDGQARLGDEVAVEVGTTVEFRVDATDDIGVTEKSLRLGNETIPLDAFGRASRTMNTIGLFDALATARDAAGNVASALRHLRVYDPSDTTFPTVVIHAPGNDSLVGKPANVVVTVSDPALELYTVDFARLDQVDVDHLEASNPAWVNLSTGTSSITNTTVGVFDPTILLNDDYVIRAVGRNVNGRIQTRGVIVHVFGNLKLGEFRLEFTDLAIPVAGIPIEVKRIYDSRQSRDTLDFGYGWSLGIQDARIRETLRTSTVGYRTLYPGARVYINTPDGRRVGFTAFTIRVYCFGFCFADIGLRPDPGVYEKLDLADGNTAVFYQGYYLDGLASGPFDPENYRLTLKDGTVYEYSQAAGLKKVTDLNGNRLEFTPGGITHYLAGDTSPDQQVPFVRDARGRIQRVVDPNGNSLTYTYDAAGDLRTFTDQVGNRSQYAYHAARPHYLATIVDPLGHQAVRAEFDDAGRITSVTDALGNRVSEAFDLGSNIGTFTDARGNITLSTYDDEGNVVKKVEPEGGVTEFRFDANNNEVWRKNPRGFTSERAYDANGNITLSTDALGKQTAVTYNALNKPTSVTDALMHTTQFSYDAHGGLTGVLDAIGGTSTFARDAAGRVTDVTDFNGHTVHYDYTGGCSCGRPHMVTNPDGSTRRYEYNNFGQVTLEVDELGNETRSNYDDSGRLTWVRNAEGDTTYLTYAATLKTSEMDPLKRTTAYGYDAANRQTSITDALGGVVRFHYDAAGNRDSVVDPVGNVTRFVYDRDNRLVEQIDPLGHNSTFSFDAAGNRIEAIDRNHRRRTFEYDALNRLTKEQWWEGGTVVRTLNYSFNPLGAMTGAIDPASTLTFTFDALNRMTQAAQTGVAGLPDFTLTYGYDPQSNVLSTTDNAGVQVHSEYDVRNRLSRRTWQGGGLPGPSVRFSYDPSGNRTNIERYSNVTSTQLVGQSTYGFNRLGAITSILHADASRTTLSDYKCSRDAAQQITQRVLGGQAADYSYDLTGQLTRAQHSGPQSDESYAYDANGNRTGGAYAVDAGNRITMDGVHAYIHDKEGNLTLRTTIATQATTTYIYDHRNRLVNVAERDGGGSVIRITAFDYDALDRRISKRVNTAVSRFLLDQENAWADADSTGAISTHYLVGSRTDEMLARTTREGVSWYLTDNLGTVIDLVDSSGALANRMRYDSFGRVVAESAPVVGDRFLFTGRELDSETGLYFYRARYYSPSFGRFLSEDPRGIEASDYNGYRYVNNAPLDKTDPSGEIAFISYSKQGTTITESAPSVFTIGRLSAAPARIIVAGLNYAKTGFYGVIRGGSKVIHGGREVQTFLEVEGLEGVLGLYKTIVQNPLVQNVTLRSARSGGWAISINYAGRAVNEVIRVINTLALPSP